MALPVSTSTSCFSLPVVSLSLLSPSPCLPACLSYFLTRPHLSFSPNRKSVLLWCGSTREIMEMVENILVVRGEANSKGSLPPTLLPCGHPPLGGHAGWGQRAQELWPEVSRDSCRLLPPAVCLETAAKHTLWRSGRMGEHQADTSSSEAAGCQRKAPAGGSYPGPPVHTGAQQSKYLQAFCVHLALFKPSICVFELVH